MDHIDTYFTNTIKPDGDSNRAIRAAIGLGKKTLNRYYSNTDAVEVYRIAMSTLCLFFVPNSSTDIYTVLHPRHKLEYFKTAAWEQDWMETAEALVRDEFERSYSALPVADEEGDKGDSDVEMVTAAPVRFSLLTLLKCCLTVFVPFRQKQRQIFSTTSRRSKRPHVLQPLLMNFASTFHLHRNTSRIPFDGGMRSGLCSLGFTAWL